MAVAYAIKSCNKCHLGKVVFNSQNENVGSLKNEARIRLCIKLTRIKARQPKLSEGCK